MRVGGRKPGPSTTTHRPRARPAVMVRRPELTPWSLVHEVPCRADDVLKACTTHTGASWSRLQQQAVPCKYDACGGCRPQKHARALS